MCTTPRTVIAFVLEPLGPDQCEKQVEHDHARANRQDHVLHRPHTFSSAQIEANNSANTNAVTTTKTMSEINTNGSVSSARLRSVAAGDATPLERTHEPIDQ